MHTTAISAADYTVGAEIQIAIVRRVMAESSGCRYSWPVHGLAHHSRHSKGLISSTLPYLPFFEIIPFN